MQGLAYTRPTTSLLDKLRKDRLYQQQEQATLEVNSSSCTLAIMVVLQHPSFTAYHDTAASGRDPYLRPDTCTISAY